MHASSPQAQLQCARSHHTCPHAKGLWLSYLLSTYVNVLHLVCHIPQCSCHTRGKQQRPGIAKNDKNNGTNKTSNKPTMLLPNSQRTRIKPVHLASGTVSWVWRHTSAGTPCYEHTRHKAQAQHPMLIRGQDELTTIAQILDCTCPCEQIKP